MPTIALSDATEKLAEMVAQAKPNVLAEIYADLFPESPSPPAARDVASYVRTELEPEELVDLWNVVFPEDHHVWYNEVDGAIYYNEEMAGYAD